MCPLDSLATVSSRASAHGHLQFTQEKSGMGAYTWPLLKVIGTSCMYIGGSDLTNLPSLKAKSLGIFYLNDLIYQFLTSPTAQRLAKAHEQCRKSSPEKLQGLSGVNSRLAELEGEIKSLMAANSNMKNEVNSQPGYILPL